MVLAMSFIEIRTPQKFTNPEGLILVPDLSSNLLVDLDADTIQGSHGSTISRWEAGGELGIVLDTPIPYTDANQMPTLGKNGAGGRNYVQFTSSNSLYAASRTPIAGEDEPITVAFVLRDDSSVTTGRILGGHDPVPNYRNIQMLGNKVAVGGSVSGQGELRAVLPSVAPVGEWGAYVARSGNGKLSIMSSFGGSVEIDALSGPLTGLVMGTNFGGNAPLTGSIACLRIYGREMTDAESKILLQNISDSYSIPVA